MNKKLICLIPTWNEEWILDFTLKHNSRVFDFIIVLDQMSSDKTVEIASAYDNVIIQKNPSKSFNEDERQLILIEHARKMYPQSILFALDADEILYTEDLNAFRLEVLKLNIGVNIYMPWLDVFPNLGKALITNAKQFAYIDDGIAHAPLNMHSPRLPSGRDKFNLQNGVVIHLQYVNLNRNRSKHLWYIHYEMSNFKIKNRIRLLTKYLHFVFRRKKTSIIINKFCQDFNSDLGNLESAIDKIWTTRLNNDFPNQDKIILDVYDYFVFNKKIDYITKFYALMTFIVYNILKTLTHLKKIISGYYFGQCSLRQKI
jgi:Glycosyl transferase family 2